MINCFTAILFIYLLYKADFPLERVLLLSIFLSQTSSLPFAKAFGPVIYDNKILKI